MGLDMCLTAKVYVPLLTKYTKHGKVSPVEINIEGIPGFDAKKVGNIEMNVGQWRKANQIHRWFVENVQDGEDNCKEYWVSKEQLKDLRKLCSQALKGNRKKREDLLPTQEGFFFGGTDYDEYYENDLRYTIEVIDDALKLDKCWDLYYCSSW